MRADSTKSLLLEAGDLIEEATGFTLGLVIMVGGLLLGFFPEVPEDIRSRIVRNSNSRLIRSFFKHSDHLCAKTQCNNLLWLFYLLLLLVYLLWHAWHYGPTANGFSLHVVIACSISAAASFIVGRWYWRRGKVAKVRARLDALTALARTSPPNPGSPVK